MLKTLRAALIAAFLSGAVAHAAEQPSYIGQRTSTPEDTQAINKVIDDFKAALKTKDAKLLTSLMIDENLLWASPPPPQVLADARARVGPKFRYFPEGGFGHFRDFIASSKVPVEEKFYNIRITQDGNLAWVMFDYEFLEDNRAGNYGVETWQMMKNADGQWKIASVLWTTHMLN